MMQVRESVKFPGTGQGSTKETPVRRERVQEQMIEELMKGYSEVSSSSYVSCTSISNASRYLLAGATLLNITEIGPKVYAFLFSDVTPQIRGIVKEYKYGITEPDPAKFAKARAILLNSMNAIKITNHQLRCSLHA